MAFASSPLPARRGWGHKPFVSQKRKGADGTIIPFAPESGTAWDGATRENIWQDSETQAYLPRLPQEDSIEIRRELLGYPYGIPLEPRCNFKIFAVEHTGQMTSGGPI